MEKLKMEKFGMKYYNQLVNLPNADLPFDDGDALDQLKKTYKHCGYCAMCLADYEPLFGFGQLSPKICFIGYTPDPYEVSISRSFSTNPNKKIYGMVEYLIRLDSSLQNNFYYMNLFSKDRDNKPVEDDVKSCSLSRARAEIAVVNPKYVIILGDKAASVLLGSNSMEDLRLKEHTIELDKFYTAYVTYSPKELCFKREELKDLVKEDLDFVAQRMKS